MSASGTPAQLLELLAMQGGFILHAVATQPERALTLNRTGTPEQLLEAVLGHRNWIAAHAEQPGCTERRLAEIWVLGPSDAIELDAGAPVSRLRELGAHSMPPAQPNRPDPRTDEQKLKHPRPGEMTPEARRAYRERMDGKRNREPEFD